LLSRPSISSLSVLDRILFPKVFTMFEFLKWFGGLYNDYDNSPVQEPLLSHSDLEFNIESITDPEVESNEESLARDKRFWQWLEYWVVNCPICIICLFEYYLAVKNVMACFRSSVDIVVFTLMAACFAVHMTIALVLLYSLAFTPSNDPTRARFYSNIKFNVTLFLLRFLTNILFFVAVLVRLIFIAKIC
jgi:magnesium-transporting ATPase (P-type)